MEDNNNFNCLIFASDSEVSQMLYETIESLCIFKSINKCSTIQEVLLNIKNSTASPVIIFKCDERNDEQLIRLLPDPSKLVFISGNCEHAVSAFEIGVKDFVMMPFSRQRIITAIGRALNNDKLHIAQEKIVINLGRKKVSILSSDILFVEAYGNFIKIYTEDQMYISSEKLSSFLEKAGQNTVRRCHKSYLINPKKIKHRYTDRVVLVNEKTLPLSKTYRHEFSLF